MMDWVTNDATIARKLRKIDREYENSRAKAAGYAMAEKVQAYRDAKMIREEHRARLLASLS